MSDMSFETGSPLDTAMRQQERLTISSVRAAVEKGSGVLAFQPIVQARQPKQPAFYEGLIRIIDDGGRLVPLKDFMLKQTRTRELEYFLELGGFGPTAVKDLPIRVVIPAFVVSELQTSFQMGFLLFLPFLVIDFLVSSVLMALGMMMMPPVVVALPLKLLLFVLVDGWHLVVKSLVQSFAT